MPTRPTKNARGAAPTPTRTALELAEEAGDQFDEACEHARQAPGLKGITLGPSLSVPMARLQPGRLAWSREVRAEEGRAELYYVLDPRPARGMKASGELPILDLERSRVLEDDRPHLSSPIRLLGVGSSKTAPKGFHSFVRAVIAELASESE
jgi:hypothetical protein